MVCYSPIQVFRAANRNEKGVRPISYKWHKDFDIPFKLPCQRCVGCRLERSRQWAGRCMHEAHCWDDAFFLTLTYDDFHLPENWSLDHKHIQDFMKRLRDRLGYPPLAYYACGEYGDQNGRPHYHMLLYGIDFPDRKIYKRHLDNLLYTSEFLEDVWGMGFCPIGDVTFESAAYVARYIMKKALGKGADEHYERMNPFTGEIYQLQPEYTQMSLKPAIGKKFFDQFKFDIYEKDEVLINNYPARPPRYYDLLLKRENPYLWEEVMIARGDAFDDLRFNEKWIHNNTCERLVVREQVKISQISTLVRSL